MFPLALLFGAAQSISEHEASTWCHNDFVSGDAAYNFNFRLNAELIEACCIVVDLVQAGQQLLSHVDKLRIFFVISIAESYIKFFQIVNNFPDTELNIERWHLCEGFAVHRRMATFSSLCPDFVRSVNMKIGPPCLHHKLTSPTAMVIKEDPFKSQSRVVDKLKQPVKLTKQQKRDLKRNQKLSPNPNQLPISTTGKTLVKPAKLTKQQKRDKKKSSATSQSFSSSEIVTKGSVYKRKANYPPLYLDEGLTSKYTVPTNRFLVEDDESYSAVIASGYNGFRFSPTDTFSDSFHSRFERAMIGLEREGKYQYDVTQPAGLGTKTAMTYVTRCVVGDPGTTYKYLGLRMFSIPWSPLSAGCSESAAEIGLLNREMVERSRVLLAERGEEVGSCEYNLTLINRC